MRLPSLIGHTAQLLRLVWNSPRPADQLVSEYFRSKKYIGSHDRRFVAQTLFAALRGSSAFEYCSHLAWDDVKNMYGELPLDSETSVREIGIVLTVCLIGNAVGVGNITALITELSGLDVQHPDRRAMVLSAQMAEITGWPEESCVFFTTAVLEYWTMLEDECNNILEALSSERLPDEASRAILAARYAMPDWFFSHAVQKTSYSSRALNGEQWFAMVELAASMLPAAPLSLRVNTIASTRGAVLDALKKNGVTARSGRLSPDCILIDKRVNLSQTPLYQDGFVEIQDEASQLAAYAVAPAPGWTVMDACAGAGGKSLHLVTLQRNKGTVIASDVEYQRLKEILPRARRAGLSGITTIQIHDSQHPGILPEPLRHLHHQCDAVLVDAPCSGFGTVRRSPMLKWRSSPAQIEKLAHKQVQIVQTFSNAVKPGGVLVYATCSVLPAENEHVVNTFLDRNRDFIPDDLSVVFADSGIAIPLLEQEAPFVTLLPSIHGCDGFFLARMRRR